jgi:hypothetical protein
MTGIPLPISFNVNILILALQDILIIRHALAARPTLGEGSM